MAIDRKLTGCDLVRMRVADVYVANQLKEQAAITQSKTREPALAGPISRTVGQHAGNEACSATLEEISPIGGFRLDVRFLQSVFKLP